MLQVDFPCKIKKKKVKNPSSPLQNQTQTQTPTSSFFQLFSTYCLDILLPVLLDLSDFTFVYLIFSDDFQ